MEQTAARPKDGRPLQNLPPATHGGFVAAVPSRAFRDGTGIFMVKLNYHLELHVGDIYLAARQNARQPPDLGFPDTKDKTTQTEVRPTDGQVSATKNVTRPAR